MKGDFRLGEWLIQPDLNRIEGPEGKATNVEPKAMEVLVYLAQHSKEVLAKERIIQVVWSDTFVTDDVLAHAISQLRKALADDARDPRIILTVPKRGYRLLVPVSHEAREETTRSLVASRRLVAGLVGAVFLLALAVSTYLILRQVNEQPGVLKPVPLTSYSGIEHFPSFSSDGRHVAFTWTPEEELGSVYMTTLGDESPKRITDAPAAMDLAPSWSPDERYIAFLRVLPGGPNACVMLISPFGGEERKLAEIPRPGPILWRPRLAWSPDSRWLVVSDRESPEDNLALFLLSVEAGEKVRLTRPIEGGDTGPAFSPDGRTLAFVRAVSGRVGDVHLLALSQELEPMGEPMRLTHLNQYLALPSWTAEGEEIVFQSGLNWHMTHLWRIHRSGKSDPVRLSFLGEDLWDPALSLDGNLVYSQWQLKADVFRLDLEVEAGDRSDPAKVFSSSRFDFVPVYSPSGDQVAFSSNRSGSFEIWICDAEGRTAPRRLTSFGEGYAVQPAWSPDGKRIAFEYHRVASPDIYVVAARGGEVRQVTTHPAHDSGPFWSADGKWIRFYSNRPDGGRWRIPASGGTAEPDPQERGSPSPDGESLYLLRDRSIWKVPAGDGGETELVPRTRQIVRVLDTGLFHARYQGGNTSEGFTLFFFDFRTGEDRPIATVEGNPWPFMQLSPDGRHLLFARLDFSADLMLVENFR